MHVKLREIIEENKFQEELKLIEKDVKRSDQFLSATKWTLARKPEKGIPIEDSQFVYAITMTEIPKNPPVVIYYTFDDDHVWLLSIRNFPDK